MSAPRRDPFVPTADEADMACAARFENRDAEIRDALYRESLVAMLKDVLSIAELEAMAGANAFRLEYEAADPELACRAIVNHCAREIAASTIRSGDTTLPAATRQELLGRIRILTDLRERWLARHPIPEHLRSHIP